MAKGIATAAAALAVVAFSGCGDLLSRMIPMEGDRIEDFAVEKQLGRVDIDHDSGRVTFRIAHDAEPSLPAVKVSKGATLIPITGEYVREMFKGKNFDSLWNELKGASDLAAYTQELLSGTPGFSAPELTIDINFINRDKVGFLVISQSGKVRFYEADATYALPGQIDAVKVSYPVREMGFLTPFDGQREATVEITVAGLASAADAAGVAISLELPQGVDSISFSGNAADDGRYDPAEWTKTFAVKALYDGGAVGEPIVAINASAEGLPDGSGSVGGPTRFEITAYDGVNGGARTIPLGMNNYRAFHEFMNGDSSSRHYILLEDIDCLSFGSMKPIGAQAKFSFAGVFDGNGHAIKHADITGDEQVGLFGSIGTGAVIRNLRVQGKVSGQRYVGGIIGNMLGGRIENCSFDGTVTVRQSDNGNEGIGGIVGKMTGYSEIKGSRADVIFEGSDADRVGGIVGDFGDPESAVKIVDSYAKGSVTGNIGVGGIVGAGIDGAAPPSINRAYFNGSVSGASYVGGTLGYGDNFGIGGAVFIGSISRKTGGDDNFGAISGSGFSGRDDGNFSNFSQSQLAGSGYYGNYVSEIPNSQDWWEKGPKFEFGQDKAWEFTGDMPRLSWEIKKG